jgi:drug/metabolite transporter (DMT)-like permease
MLVTAAGRPREGRRDGGAQGAAPEDEREETGRCGTSPSPGVAGDRPMSVGAVPVALAAAVAFGWSAALMHHGASSAPEGSTVTALLVHVVRQWRWLLGMAASLSGLALHALALHLGTIAVVQPLIVTGLVFSFLFRAALDRALPHRATMAWALLTGLGLTVFLLAGSPSGGHSASGAGSTVMLVAGAAAVAAAWLAAARVPRRAGLLLGAAAGVVFGLIAGTLKATTLAAARGVPALLTSWPVYVLVALGATGFLLNQRSYHAAPLSRSLPVSNTLNPLVALVFGVVGFGERPPSAPARLAAEAVGLTLVLTGVFLLARTEEEA